MKSGYTVSFYPATTEEHTGPSRVRLSQPFKVALGVTNHASSSATDAFPPILIVDGIELTKLIAFALSSYAAKIESIVNFHIQRSLKADLTWYLETLGRASTLITALNPGATLRRNHAQTLITQKNPVLRRRGDRLFMITETEVPISLTHSVQVRLRKCVESAQYPGEAEHTVRMAFHAMDQAPPPGHHGQKFRDLRRVIDAIFSH